MERSNGYFFGKDKSFFSAEYNSHIIETNDLKIGEKRNLMVDYHVALPLNVPIRMLVTSVMFYMHEQFLNWVLKLML